MADATVRVGAEAHLDTLATLREDVALAGWIPSALAGPVAHSRSRMRDLQRYLDRAPEEAVHAVTEVHPVAMGLSVDMSPVQRSPVSQRLSRGVWPSHGVPTQGCCSWNQLTSLN